VPPKASDPWLSRLFYRVASSKNIDAFATLFKLVPSGAFDTLYERTAAATRPAHIRLAVLRQSWNDDKRSHEWWKRESAALLMSPRQVQWHTASADMPRSDKCPAWLPSFSLDLFGKAKIESISEVFIVALVLAFLFKLINASGGSKKKRKKVGGRKSQASPAA